MVEVLGYAFIGCLALLCLTVCYLLFKSIQLRGYVSDLLPGEFREIYGNTLEPMRRSRAVEVFGYIFTENDSDPYEISLCKKSIVSSLKMIGVWVALELVITVWILVLTGDLQSG